MKIDLETTLKTLGLPVGLALLFSALLGLAGLSLDQVLAIALSLVGFAALIGLLLDVCKWAGVLPEGWAGKVSAALNLAALVVIAIVLKLYPAFDFASADAQIAEFVKAAAVVFAYIIQLTGSKSVHTFVVNGIGIKSFQYTP